VDHDPRQALAVVEGAVGVTVTEDDAADGSPDGRRHQLDGQLEGVVAVVGVALCAVHREPDQWIPFGPAERGAGQLDDPGRPGGDGGTRPERREITPLE
jgi:hypothetical protein